MRQIEVKRRQVESLAHLVGAGALLVLGSCMRENGLAYFAAAYELVSFVWILVGQGLSDALGRMLRAKSARGQYGSAERIRRSALIFQSVLGALAGILAASLGSLAVQKGLRLAGAALVTVLFAAVLFLRMVEEVLLGFCQGNGSEFPGAASALLRPVLWLGFGLVFGNLCAAYGEKVSALLKAERFVGMYGAVGAAVAAVLTEIFLLLFLGILCRGSGGGSRSVAPEGVRAADSFGGIVGALHKGRLLEILAGLLGKLPVWTGLLLLAGALKESADAESVYGIVYGNYLAITGGIVCLMDGLLLPAAAKVQGGMRRNDPKYARDTFQTGLHVAVVYGLFFSVFFTVLGGPVAETLCGRGAETGKALLSCGSFLILLAGLGVYFCRLLWIGGRRLLLLLGLGAMDAAFGLSAFLLAGALGFRAEVYVYAGLIAGGVLCVILGTAVIRELGAGMDWVQTFGIPAGCACVVGLLGLFVGKAMAPHFGAAVTAAVCLAAAWILYWMALILLRNFREQDLKQVPFGGLVRALGQILRVYP